MDRQRRKQAEFLVYRFCPWTLIDEVAVFNSRAKSRVEGVLSRKGDEGYFRYLSDLVTRNRWARGVALSPKGPIQAGTVIWRLILIGGRD